MYDIHVKVDGQVENILQGLMSRLGNLKPATRLMGEIVLESIVTNFEQGGRPGKWDPLAAATIRQRQRKGKWPGRILVQSGHAGGLLGAIAYTPGDTSVTIHANKRYARIHHYGGQAGKGHKTTIPARPYMMVQDEDWEDIRAGLNDYILGGK